MIRTILAGNFIDLFWLWTCTAPIVRPNIESVICKWLQVGEQLAHIHSHHLFFVAPYKNTVQHRKLNRIHSSYARPDIVVNKSDLLQAMDIPSVGQ